MKHISKLENVFWFAAPGFKSPGKTKQKIYIYFFYINLMSVNDQDLTLLLILSPTPHWLTCQSHEQTEARSFTACALFRVILNYSSLERLCFVELWASCCSSGCAKPFSALSLWPEDVAAIIVRRAAGGLRPCALLLVNLSSSIMFAIVSREKCFSGL